MASIFSFSTRSRERDEETDNGRFGRLRAHIARVGAEIESERAGLEARYRREATDAAFLLEALSNDDAPIRSQARAEHLTSSILRCEQRLAALASQAELLNELRSRLERFHRG